MILIYLLTPSDPGRNRLRPFFLYVYAQDVRVYVSFKITFYGGKQIWFWPESLYLWSGIMSWSYAPPTSQSYIYDNMHLACTYIHTKKIHVHIHTQTHTYVEMSILMLISIKIYAWPTSQSYIHYNMYIACTYIHTKKIQTCTYTHTHTYICRDEYTDAYFNQNTLLTWNL